MGYTWSSNCVAVWQFSDRGCGFNDWFNLRQLSGFETICHEQDAFNEIPKV